MRWQVSTRHPGQSDRHVQSHAARGGADEQEWPGMRTGERGVIVYTASAAASSTARLVRRRTALQGRTGRHDPAHRPGARALWQYLVMT